MEQVISKCGNMCSSCPWGVWIRRNQREEDWEPFAADVKKYLGFTPAKNPCHGCQTPNEKLSKDVGVHNFLRGCSARRCAFHNDFQNCAYCSRYPCEKIQSLNVSNSRSHVEERMGEPIPDDKYVAYVRIFEGKMTLDEIRANLPSNQIQEVKTIERKQLKIVPFPDVKKKYLKFRELHDALDAIFCYEFALLNTDTIAVQAMLIDRRAVLQRLLWILASFGIIEKDSLRVDAITISTHKKGTSGFPTSLGGWTRWIELLSEAGINGTLQLAPVETSQLISPIGWLRDRLPSCNDPAYHISITLDETLGGVSTLKLLQSYAHQLEDENGKKAFSLFKKADMRFLQNKE